MSREENYEDWRFTQIIRRREKPKELTPTEKLTKEFEEIERERMSIVKSTEIDTILPTLRELMDDEKKGIEEYKKFYELLRRVVFTTGGLEDESNIIKRILEDEVKHLTELERVKRKLTLG